MFPNIWFHQLQNRANFYLLVWFGGSARSNLCWSQSLGRYFQCLILWGNETENIWEMLHLNGENSRIPGRNTILHHQHSFKNINKEQNVFFSTHHCPLYLPEAGEQWNDPAIGIGNTENGQTIKSHCSSKSWPAESLGAPLIPGLVLDSMETPMKIKKSWPYTPCTSMPSDYQTNNAPPPCDY